MKILQVNCVYKYGSTGKIVYDIHRHMLDHGVESVVCYGRGKRLNEQNIYKTSVELYSKLNSLYSRFSGIMYGGCFFSTEYLKKVIQFEKPDIVHLHCINGYFVNVYRLLNFLAKSKIKTLLTLHAEFMYTGGCSHTFDCDKWETGCGGCPRRYAATRSVFLDRTHEAWQKMYKALHGFDRDQLTVASVSPWLMSRASRSPMLKHVNHRVVLNGIDTSLFYFRDCQNLIDELGASNKKIILYVTPRFSSQKEHIKGGYYVLELAKRLLNKDCMILVAGAYDRQTVTLPNIRFLGSISNRELLAQYYSLADVTLLTSKVETFSMVCAESQCCGTPVVGFFAGAPEQIAMPEFSRFSTYSDMDQLEQNILSYLDSDSKLPSKHLLSEKACEHFSNHAMVSKYLSLYNKMLSGSKLSFDSELVTSDAFATPWC